MADFSVKEQQGAEGITLSLEGSLTIEHASEMRDLLMDAFSRGGDVTVDLSQAEGVDLTGLQLMCAAHRTSIGLGRKFVLLGSTQPEIRKSAGVAGYYRHVGCAEDVTKTCVWREER